MAMPLVQLINGSGIATALMLDWAGGWPAVSYQMSLKAGTGTWQFQYTLENPNVGGGVATTASVGDVYSSNQTTNITWLTDANGTAVSANATGTFSNFPVQAVRLNVATAFANSTGNFSLQLVVLQTFPAPH